MSAAAHLCCTGPQLRIDSPEPPSRPLAAIDSIFAAAALPEDHPHAWKFPHRKPGFDTSIVKSPGLGSRIRLQFRRRRSRMNLGMEGGYDEDAHALTSLEVLRDGGRVEEEGGIRCGSGEEGKDGGSDEGDATIVMGSLEYLMPLIVQASGSRSSASPDDVAELAIAIAPRVRPAISSDEIVHPFSALPRSFSLPLFSNSAISPPLSPRRSRSDSGLGDIKPQSMISPSTRSSWKPSSGGTTGIPTLHLREPTNDGILESILELSVRGLKREPSENALHLHNMGISQQLRCMSQLSDVAENDSLSASPHPWTFHHRERVDHGRESGFGRHRRHASSSGIDSATVPACWGRVRSPMHDAASSVYSRPTSAGASGVDHREDSPDTEPPVPPVDLYALFSDWPLKPSASMEQTKELLRPVSERSVGSERRNKSLPPTPEGIRKDSGTTSFVTAANNAEEASVRWLSPPQRAISIDSKSNASTLTKTSKRSKLLERISPPKKQVRKRRSIFRFLRPGSRKQQARSISTPVLSDKSTKACTSYDGQSEDPALLTVHYDLDERPTHTIRSASMNNLSTIAHADMPSQLPVPHALQRHPTLADYERNLSVVGDDRRRPSAVDMDRAKEVHDDDHRHSLGLGHRLSRACPLKDYASPLMAQALEKHQQEKALFRSASKQRESLTSSARTVPVFKSSPFSSLAPTIDERSKMLDRHDKSREIGTRDRSYSSTFLLPPGAMTTTPAAASLNTAATDRGSSAHPAPKKRIGTSLESWSRYPSHTRAERCGSAGRPDNVVSRDFAVDIDHADIQESDDAEAISPDSKRTNRSKRSKNALPKSRSMTFSSIVRYYSNLFSSSSVGQNRRTSITTGGRLKYPELEMIPPQLAADPLPLTHPKHSSAFTRVKEIVKEDAEKIREFVKAEEEKVEEFVKNEEDKLETFVKREESIFEGFVKKEETIVKDYVKAEEEKLAHLWYHRPVDSAPDKDSPFCEISLFEVPTHHSPQCVRRKETVIGPTENVDEEHESESVKASSDAVLRLDGAGNSTSDIKQNIPSKAEVWSGLYRECLARPTETTAYQTPSNAMPPPALKPTKPRSPQQPTPTDPHATIRKFPSVTVIDDRKGHFRSISLISVKTCRSTGFERTSTHDLLELVQAREREERDKLLKPLGSQELVQRHISY